MGQIERRHERGGEVAPRRPAGAFVGGEGGEELQVVAAEEEVELPRRRVEDGCWVSDGVAGLGLHLDDGRPCEAVVATRAADELRRYDVARAVLKAGPTSPERLVELGRREQGWH